MPTSRCVPPAPGSSPVVPTMPTVCSVCWAPRSRPGQQFERSLAQVELQMARGQYAPAWREAVRRGGTAPRPAEATPTVPAADPGCGAAGRRSRSRPCAQASRASASPPPTPNARPPRAVTCSPTCGSAIDRVACESIRPTAREPLLRGWLEGVEGQIAASRGHETPWAPKPRDRSLARALPRASGRHHRLRAKSSIAGCAHAADAPLTPVARGSIALLLPLTGTLCRGTAELVRDGFLAGHRTPAADRRSRPSGARLRHRHACRGIDAALQTAQSRRRGVSWSVR